MKLTNDTINCSRCERPSPIRTEEITGDGGGDPALLVIVVPPPGWMDDPDDVDRIICRACATQEERDAWDDDVTEAERIIAETVEAMGGPPVGPEDPFSDAEMIDLLEDDDE